MHSNRRGQAVDPLEESEERDEVSMMNGEKVQKMDDIVAKAQASIARVKNSPFGRLAMPGEGRPNDSLDAMRLDFINDFQKVMRESGETFFRPEHPTLSAQKTSQKYDYMSDQK